MPGGGAETFSSDEFIRRVAAREGVDVVSAAAHARAVLETLLDAVG
jgi:uncharacterized protein (DUF2267 family)